MTPNKRQLQEAIRRQLNDDGDDLFKAVQELIAMSNQIKPGETAGRDLRIADIWKYELRVTKLREPNDTK